ncbi:hypothetical protein NFX52_30515, partial [Acidovorax facilis]|uniref:hypothetical protein n=1 Tax=Acidovorax facilis TaxID=12917 RepID=UPI00208DF824
KVKKRLKKAGSKTIPEPGSVSRLAGSAHRWDELYADGVHGKTIWSRTNCSSIENNPSIIPRSRVIFQGSNSVGKNCIFIRGIYLAPAAPLIL